MTIFFVHPQMAPSCNAAIGNPHSVPNSPIGVPDFDHSHSNAHNTSHSSNGSGSNMGYPQTMQQRQRNIRLMQQQQFQQQMQQNQVCLLGKSGIFVSFEQQILA